MYPQGPSEGAGQLPGASEVTVGLFSWLEDLSAMWRARQLGEDVRVPGLILLSMYVTAAALAACSCLCDLVSRKCIEWHRTRRLERRLAKLARQGRPPFMTPHHTG